MDFSFILFALFSAPIVIVLIAEPNALKNLFKKDKQYVGPTYWGIYPGSKIDEESNLKCILVAKSHAREKVIAGSKSYMGKSSAKK